MTRFLNLLFALGLMFFAIASHAATDTLIPFGDTWRYLDTGASLGASWQNSIRTGWSTGPAQLGYGDGDEATVVDCSPNPPGSCGTGNNFITTYFQRVFTCSNPSSYIYGQVRLLRDDGIIVYLNGTEIYRNNMPAGPAGSQTRASTSIGGEAESTILTATFDPDLLQSGNNILSAEVHQHLASSNDISFDLELKASTTGFVTRGPYLQMSSSNRITVRWRTSAPTNSRVRYGTSLANLSSSASKSPLTTEHVVELTSLAHSTKYFYSVGTSTETLAGGDANHFFFTHPPVGTDKATRIWVLGDSGFVNQDARDVRDAYLNFTGSTHTDLWLMLGDNAYDSGLDSEYQGAIFDMHPTMLRKSVLWPTLGNHDGISADSSSESGPYYNIFTLPRAAESGGVASGTEAYYSFDFANIHFICLDSHDTNRSVNGLMHEWLENDIAATNQDWIIAFFHHPPYSHGTHNSDDPDDSDGRMVDMRERFVPLLEEGGVDLVLTGHSHSYERSHLIDGHYGFSNSLTSAMILDDGDGRPSGDGAYIKHGFGPQPHQGAVYAVAGSSADISESPIDHHPVMFIYMKVLGSMVLDINGNRMDARFLNVNGTSLDTFTIQKVAATPSPTPTQTPTPTPTPTPSPTPSPTPTPTPIPTPPPNITRDWSIYH